jgi:hypothetical protein
MVAKANRLARRSYDVINIKVFAPQPVLLFERPSTCVPIDLPLLALLLALIGSVTSQIFWT